MARTKVDHLNQKLKVNKTDRMEKKVAREVRENGVLVVDKKEKSKSFQETPSMTLLPKL